MHKTLTDAQWNGPTRLGAAYYLREDWPAAAALPPVANAREATDTEGFLLALAFHHRDPIFPADAFAHRG